MSRHMLTITIICCCVASPNTATGQNDLNRELQLHGIALPLHHVTVSPLVPGTVTSFEVSEGDVVEKGDTLAVIDDRVARATVEQARIAAQSTAALSSARIDVHQSEAFLVRVEKAYRRGASSDIELEVARIELQKAKAQLQFEQEQQAQAEQELRLAEALLDQHVIKAPFGGRIVQLHARLGAAIGPQEPLATVSAIESLRITLHLPLSLFGQFSVGDPCELQAEAPLYRSLMSKVVSASPVIDPATRTFRVVFEIENSDGTLPAGFSATLSPAAQAGLEAKLAATGS